MVILPTNSSRLHLADGSVLTVDDGYGDFVEYVNTLSKSYSQFFCTEEEFSASVTEYGSCGKYVVTDTYVRLPKVSDILKGITDISLLGGLNEAGLPNITGSFTASDYGFSYSGAFYKIGDGSGEPDRTGCGATVGFKASRSNAIYGNSDTVQPQSVNALLYIVVKRNEAGN